ncbi:MAG: ISL3 family transposase [Actinomycetota bacterium]|nr:ISL3 family transposase [Actinomycetota bacterium]
MPDSMSVRLHLHRIRVIEVLTDLPDRLEVVIRDLRSVVRCPFCGFKTSKVHETRRIKVRDLAHGGRPTTLLWLRRRFECTSCGERHTESHPAIEGKLTARLARAIVNDARQLSITEVGRRHGLSWHTVMALVRAWSERVGERRRARPCRVLLIDETSLRRRHRYVTVVSNGETGDVLAVVSHRDYRALSGFLASQGQRWCRRVEVVVTDGSHSYRAAVERHLGGATHVVDRFHVVRWFAAGLIEVRRRVQRIGEPGESPAFNPDLFRTRYLQLARAQHLGSEQFARLAHALMQDPELWHAWRLTQQLYEIYDAPDEEEAAARIEAFVQAWSAAPIPEFRSVLKALAQWLPEILAFHRCGRVTNGRLEGTNNKLGVLKRIAYGFVNADNFAARALLWCPPVAS